MRNYDIDEVTLMDINALIDRGERFRLIVKDTEFEEVTSLDSLREDNNVATGRKV